MDNSGAPTRRILTWKLAALLLGIAFVTGVTQVSDSRLAVPVGSAFVPFLFAFVAVLARLGDTEVAARPLGLLFLTATLSGLAFGSLALIGLHVIEPGTLKENSRDVVFLPEGEARLSFMMGLLALTGATTMLGLFRNVREAVKDIIPIDPALYSHALAFSTAIAVSLLPLLPLFVLGKPPLPLPPGSIPEGSPGFTYQTFAERSIELGWYAVATFIAAGPGAGRRWPALQLRLGLILPTWRHAGLAFAAGAALVWLQPIASSFLTSWLRLPSGSDAAWLPTGLPWLTASALSLLAATGVEITYRGFFQPRLGLVLTNLVLVAPMAWTHHWNVLFMAFGVGCVFGVLRSTAGTVAAVIAHAVFLTGVAAFAG